MAQVKEQIKAPEKIQLSDEESQPIRCTVQKTGTQDAHRNGGVWLQNRGKSEIQENIKGTKSEGKETGTQINDLERRKYKHSTGTE